ncbi:hypothetical protein J1614_005661 [Plenodomus biglobosus]|nr:hypothetical protein J1614_005661 [Plenodomus biglobosus]
MLLNSMGYEHMTPSSVDKQDENDSLLQDSGGLRPYQPYCVTEASSRPQSPDTFVPKPLRILPARKPISTSTSTTPERLLQQVDVNIVCSSSLTTTPDRPYRVEALETGSKSNIRSPTTNRNHLPGNTQSVNSNHIAQAVTPRGRHLLAPAKKTSYDETPSPRMQPIEDMYTSPHRVLRRKSLPPSARHIGIAEQVPLLSTTTDHCSEEDSNNLEKPLELEEDTESVTVIEPDGTLSAGVYADSSSTPPTVLHHSFEADATRFPTSEFHNLDHPVLAPRPAIVQEELLWQASGLPQISPTSRSRDPSRSPHATDLRHYHAQFPSPEEDYTPRDLSSGAKYGWAHRRTEPKDAQLRYQFGRRPFVSLDHPPLTPSRQSFNHQTSIGYFRPASTSNHYTPTSVTNCTPSLPVLPAPSRYSHEPKVGPRPPPWISFEALEAQRRQRGDTRERADAALLRSRESSSSSLHQTSVRGDGANKVNGTLRSEVEEYRVAVLKVYPDMEFDEETGKETRMCCCAVM